MPVCEYQTGVFARTTCPMSILMITVTAYTLHAQYYKLKVYYLIEGVEEKCTHAQRWVACRQTCMSSSVSLHMLMRVEYWRAIYQCCVES
jgi:hypothetical protein